MNVKAYILASLVFSLLAACSHIDESERLIYVKPVAVKRHILLEDFTGQRCVNCPKASEEIKRLQDQYGEENVIAVGIHSGPLGFHTNSKFVGLSTDVGDEYYNYWALEYQPVGMIDRGSPIEYTAWNTRVREDLEKNATVDIEVFHDCQEGRLTVRAEVSGVDGPTEGRLQLWLTEDSVTAFQLMPDGTLNKEYVHQHVFRAAVNGIWGENINIGEGETLSSQNHELTIPEEWNSENMYIVAFVYNEQGVQQVCKSRL